MLTKPSTDSLSHVGFLNDFSRLNFALTRVRKLLLLVGNLDLCNPAFVKKAKNGSSCFLAGFLEDLATKQDITRWRGPESVTLGIKPEKAVSPGRRKRPPLHHGLSVNIKPGSSGDTWFSGHA
ncbi:hypothetical protein N7540_005445 [Penicillium herquei]|nr:hypothetical protein N7540_005445 [Penicillium herquei]